VAAVLSLPALVGCGQLQERDLCRQWEDLQGAAAQVEQLDPATATAADLDAVANDVLVEVQQLQATSEGLYDQAVTRFRESLVELRQAAIEVGDEELEAARELLQDDWNDTRTAYQLLAQRLDVACGSAGGTS
jgi:hypothetical protein